MPAMRLRRPSRKPNDPMIPSWRSAVDGRYDVGDDRFCTVHDARDECLNGEERRNAGSIG